VGVETQEKPKSMFCEVDRAHLVDEDTNKFRNHISSSYPAYMHKHGIEKLEESVDEIASALDEKRADPRAVEFYRRKLSREKTRLDDIREQTPKFDNSEMAHIKNSFENLEKEVASALYTEKDMETGKGIDPAEEARRMTNPVIPIDKWLAESCNVKVRGGKCSRSEAEKVLKIANWHLTGGDKTYLVENLRIKRGGSAAKSSSVTVDVDLKEMERYRKLEEKIEMLEDKLKVEEWECKEDGCKVVLTKDSERIHKAMHTRERNKDKKKQLVGKE